MLTFLIKSPGHKPYTKCLPSNAAAVLDAERRFPGSSPASVVNLQMSRFAVGCRVLSTPHQKQERR